jgi:parvulin-like peptidyl-prolyl isomerase
LLSKNGVEVTFIEAFAYSLRHTNPDAYTVSISKPRAATRVVENLYVLERVSALLESSSLVSREDRLYIQEDVFRRSNLELYLNALVSSRLEEIDWNGLALAEYAMRKNELIAPEEVRVEHLLISTEGVPFEGFVKRVLTVQTKIAAGEQFEDLIIQFSDDPSVVQNRGDLGFFTRDRMQPAFSDAAFSLQNRGDVSGPVMTRFGAHFIRLLDRRDESPLTFAEVRTALIEEIKKSTRARLRDEFLSEVRSEIEAELVEINEQILIDRFVNFYQKENHPKTEP